MSSQSQSRRVGFAGVANDPKSKLRQKFPEERYKIEYRTFKKTFPKTESVPEHLRGKEKTMHEVTVYLKNMYKAMGANKDDKDGAYENCLEVLKNDSHVKEFVANPSGKDFKQEVHNAISKYRKGSITEEFVEGDKAGVRFHLLVCRGSEFSETRAYDDALEDYKERHDTSGSGGVPIPTPRQ